MSWQLYSSPRSPFVAKVLVAAHELGLAGRLTRIDVVTTPMTPAPELLPVNPVGMIPALVADGEMIFDSFVILEFLESQSDRPLIPTGAGRRECLTRHAMANAMTDKAVRILDEQFRVQNTDTAEHREGFIAAIRRGILWMEPRLADARFDAGDICFAVLLAYLDFRFPAISWRDDAPAVARWHAEAARRPSMTATAFPAVAKAV
ncbi:glutathione S-transferase family protein [Martelella sp. HB161492]|uniref:glutathione S-transferase family protein n=1 Tax=Martelella sp. HB161492 TaxID=2720726 RepID=UPI001590B3F1|nr:glutathione S-transferase family protein [Martelella sp. HB161492]